MEPPEARPATPETPETDPVEEVATTTPPRLELRAVRLRVSRSRAGRKPKATASASPAVIDLSIEAGETVTLLGSNHDDLVAILELCVGLTRPVTGSVSLDGSRIHHRRLGLQLVSRRGPLPRRNSVTEVVDLRARLLGIERARRPERIEEALETVGLRKLAERPVRDLNGSEQHRLRLALGLLADPLLLCVDLPGSAFDLEGPNSLPAIARTVNRRGGSVLLTATSFGDRERRTDRCARIEDGRLLWVLASTEIRASKPVFEVRFESPITVALQQRVKDEFGLLSGSSFERGRLLIEFDSDDGADDWVAFCAETGLRMRSLVRQRASLDQLVPPIPEGVS